MPKRLVIVESPAKARTISRFLGEGYVVDSSIGHIRDLPESASQIPTAVKKEPWARLGVNVESEFEPIYVVPADKKKKVSELKESLKGADELLLATDEDREGEAISWHLVELLKPKIPYRRLVFHEITREAIREALDQTRPIDDRLVAAQETRRIVDRLYGYEISPLLWKKIRPRLSAGRVQSVAIKMIVERERARMRFTESITWDLEGTFRSKEGKEFPARLVSLSGTRLATGKDFDPDTGRLTAAGALVLGEDRARALLDQLADADWKVTETETREYKQTPPPPFTTSTLQQEGGRKLRFTAKRTMRAAQRLYENGYITYMRTDSTTLSDQAVRAARKQVGELYGDAFLSKEPRQYRTKVKNAQEAHEAIRPAGESFRTPAQVKGDLQDDEFKLYELIWKRTVASQMAGSRGRRMTLRLAGQDAIFQANGKVVDFPGYLRAYVEGSDTPEADLAEMDVLLPPLERGDPLTCSKLEPKEHRTTPPARYTEASLVKELEARGIGRPSTYASILDTIERREYTFKRGSALVPAFLAFAVVNLMERYFTELVDENFTARMEDDLDAISRGEAESLPYLRNFYFGNGQKGLRTLLEEHAEGIDPREVCTISLGAADGGDDVLIRIGRYGPFLQRGEETAPIPDGTAPDELTLDRAREILSGTSRPRLLGNDPETGEPITVRAGRFGPYVQLGENGGKKKPQKTQSLLTGMTPDAITFETALKLLSLPRTIGTDEHGVEIQVANGRFGPYLKRGTDTRSLESEAELFTLTVDGALKLLAQPKERRRSRRSEPLKVLGKAEALDGAEIKLMQGPYGIYVTDGTVNASVPKGTDPETVSLSEAVHWIEERKARGPSRRGGRRGGRRAASTNAGDAPAASKTTGKSKTAAKRKSTATSTSKKSTAAKKAKRGTRSSKKAPANRTA